MGDIGDWMFEQTLLDDTSNEYDECAILAKYINHILCWQTKDDEMINVINMTDKHIKNTIKYLSKHDHTNLSETWIDIFETELEKRKIDVDDGYIRFTNKQPKINEDIIGFDENGKKYYCYRSKYGEWRCSLTGSGLLVDIVKWKYVKSKSKVDVVETNCQFCGKFTYTKWNEDSKQYLCLTCQRNRMDVLTSIIFD